EFTKYSRGKYAGEPMKVKAIRFHDTVANRMNYKVNAVYMPTLPLKRNGKMVSFIPKNRKISEDYLNGITMTLRSDWAPCKSRSQRTQKRNNSRVLLLN
ncbi:hypothetical protein, partial [Candidatus Phytoplasma pini]